MLVLTYAKKDRYYMLVQLLNHFQLFGTPWPVGRQAPLSMGFPRQEYWSGMPFPPAGDLPAPGISPALAGRFFTTSATWEAYFIYVAVSIRQSQSPNLPLPALLLFSH